LFCGQAVGLPCADIGQLVNRTGVKNMSKLFTYALAIAVCLGTTAMLANNNRNLNPTTNAEALLAADGAFRDGLYLGKLAAENGQQLRPAIGRWSNEQDRASFLAGYRRGYDESLAHVQP
jgi:hypothetical protein